MHRKYLSHLCRAYCYWYVRRLRIESLKRVNFAMYCNLAFLAKVYTEKNELSRFPLTESNILRICNYEVMYSQHAQRAGECKWWKAFLLLSDSDTSTLFRVRMALLRQENTVGPQYSGKMHRWESRGTEEKKCKSKREREKFLVLFRWVAKYTLPIKCTNCNSGKRCMTKMHECLNTYIKVSQRCEWLISQEKMEWKSSSKMRTTNVYTDENKWIITWLV